MGKLISFFFHGRNISSLLTQPLFPDFWETYPYPLAIYRLQAKRNFPQIGKQGDSLASGRISPQKIWSMESRFFDVICI